MHCRVSCPALLFPHPISSSYALPLSVASCYPFGGQLPRSWDVAKLATYFVLADDVDGVGSMPYHVSQTKYKRCGRLGYLADIFDTPERVEGVCDCCGQDGHKRCNCIINRSARAPPHINFIKQPRQHGGIIAATTSCWMR